MPFKSEKQRRFLWANHPDIAQRWADEEASATNRHLQKHKTQRRKKKRRT